MDQESRDRLTAVEVKLDGVNEALNKMTETLDAVRRASDRSEANKEVIEKHDARLDQLEQNVTKLMAYGFAAVVVVQVLTQFVLTQV